jgi:hypothetical protein
VRYAVLCLAIDLFGLTGIARAQDSGSPHPTTEVPASAATQLEPIRVVPPPEPPGPILDAERPPRVRRERPIVESPRRQAGRIGVAELVTGALVGAGGLGVGLVATGVCALRTCSDPTNVVVTSTVIGCEIAGASLIVAAVYSLRRRSHASARWLLSPMASHGVVGAELVVLAF